MNLHRGRVSRCASLSPAVAAVSGAAVLRYLLNMPRNVLNLELSSGAFSAATFEGVAAREVSRELRAEGGAEPVGAFSGTGSAM